MVSILPQGSQSGLDLLGRYVGKGVTNAMPQMYENMKYQRGMSAIDQLQNAMKPNAQGQIDQGQMLANIARAISSNPNLERSGLVDYAMKLATASNQQKVPYPGERGIPEENFLASEKQELPGFLEQTKGFGQRAQPGQFEKPSAPQEATTGIKEPLLSPTGRLQAGRKYQKESTDAGLPITLPEALQVVDAQEEAKKAHNAGVDTELKQQKEAQKTYGKRAVEYLDKYGANLNPELEAMFQKEGEDLAKEKRSESDINKELASRAKKLSDSITNIKSQLSAPRLQNALTRKATGEYKGFDQSAEDLRKHLSPLLDKGLYDSARSMLQDLGYGPEEREIIINPLSMKAQSPYLKMPRVPLSQITGTNKVNTKPLREALIASLQEDPNQSLLLARKMAEDKGYDWKDFKSTLNDLMNEGLQLSPDQQKQLRPLDTAPLNVLERILNGLNLMGR